MSWSDDTRCLFCDGRLPLYRKITHGQFCSNEHRTAYWQEQERLAVERLNHTHNSLQAHRSPVQIPAAVALQSDDIPEIISAPSFPPDAPPILEAPEMLGLLASEFVAQGGTSPSLVTIDPFEYEISRQPQPPSSLAAIPALRLPQARNLIRGWTRIDPRREAIRTAIPQECGENHEIELRHPASKLSAVRPPIAGRVALQFVNSGEGYVFAGRVSDPKFYDAAPHTVTNVALDLPVESDLVELLAQQVSHPDRLYALRPFAPPQQSFAVAGLPPEALSARPETALSAPTLAAVARDSGLEMGWLYSLPEGLQPRQGNLASPTRVSAIAPNPPAGVATSVHAPAYAAASNSMGLAGLRSLASALVAPSVGVPARQATATIDLDLSSAVSADLVFPVCSRSASAAAADSPAPAVTRILRLPYGRTREFAVEVAPPAPMVRLIPVTAEQHPAIPHSRLEPLDRKPPEDALRAQKLGLGSFLRGDGLKTLEPAWAHATGFWQHAPRDLKLLLFAIPALLALVFHPGLPRVAFAAPQSAGGFSSQMKQVLNDQWVSMRQSMENRAAIELDEDFRSGLDNWVSPGGSTTEWAFDSTGFVQPGPLALYRPSVTLGDYQAQFMGLIDKKALSWVVRAADFDNFYVVKLTMLKSGPLPVIGLTRYAVIGGKAQDRHDVAIPIDARADTLYNVRMDVRGSNFSVEVQGQMADSWTESRLPRGGIGFFTARGEASRVRWVQITHQYDMLGRLCSYLAPYDTTNGSWKP